MKTILAVFCFFHSLIYSCICFCVEDYIFNFSGISKDYDNTCNAGSGEGKMCAFNDVELMKAANDVLTVFGFDAASKEESKVAQKEVLEVLMCGVTKESDLFKFGLKPDVCLELYLKTRGGERLSKFLLEPPFVDKIEKKIVLPSDYVVTYHFRLSVLDIYQPLFQCFASIKYWHIVNVAHCISEYFCINKKTFSAEEFVVIVANLSFVRMCSHLKVSDILFNWHIFKPEVVNGSGHSMAGDDFLKDMWGFIIYYLYRFSKTAAVAEVVRENEEVAGAKSLMEEAEGDLLIKKEVLVNGGNSIKDKVIESVFDEFCKLWDEKVEFYPDGNNMTFIKLPNDECMLKSISISFFINQKVIEQVGVGLFSSGSDTPVFSDD